MANSQSYPQAGPSSIPYHHPSSPYSGPESSYPPLPHYAPNQLPQGNVGQHNYGHRGTSALYPEFIPQQRHFKKGHRHRRFPQHVQQQPQLHFYQSQPMFPPHHAVIDPYHLPPEYFPPHDLWTPPPFSSPPPHHLAYPYQPPYPQSALPKQILMPPYGGSPSSRPSHTPLAPMTLEPEVQSPPAPSEPSELSESFPAQSQDDAVVQDEKEISYSSDFVTLSIRRNIQKGIALQSERPRVHRALGVTISHTARPPASFIAFLDTDDPSPIVEQSVFYTSAIDVVNDEVTSPKHEPVVLEPSLASTVTPETSTGAETPQVGSPHSSMTSISIVAKAIPDASEEQLDLQSESSMPYNVADSEPVAQSPTLPASIPVDPTTTSSQVQSSSPLSSPLPITQPPPQPSQPVKKSWASLFRSSENEKDPVNGLPTSSIQGFSIPATPLQESIPKPARSPNLANLLMSSNVLSGRLSNIRARGLINLGNMCFANTVLQILMYCPPFYKLFSELEKHQPPKEPVTTPLINATIELMKEFRPLGADKATQEMDEEGTNRDEPFIPTVIYQALKEKKRFDSMRGGQQEDAEEFLGFYLDTLEDEFSFLLGNQTSKATAAESPADGATGDSGGDGWQEIGRKNKAILTRMHNATESPISRIFSGKFRTTLKIPGSRESAMIDPWSRLQLDIQPESVRTIEDALRYTAEQRTVQVTSPTKGQVEANQQTLIESVPPILILHLKRFLYDTSVNDVVKLSKKITFLPELVIPKDVLSTSRRFHTHRYRLFGVLNHHGSSATGGHYTLDVLHPDPRGNGQEDWIRLDDDTIQDITVDDLLSKDLGDDKAAYLLFYRRV